MKSTWKAQSLIENLQQPSQGISTPLNPTQQQKQCVVSVVFATSMLDAIMLSTSPKLRSNAKIIGANSACSIREAVHLVNRPAVNPTDFLRCTLRISTDTVPLAWLRDAVRWWT
ncbi:hypothetical protein D9758_010910 [Tetrapyrgos nigripes]|uniref:Uncharacterized protein n=1 Tax=Tetrapyrgos nigripes TaxID=182062 RepID=A0A8H5FTF4_9AGAR|nr:hypothetical protein D9758_010910 [Tetrapyrgos nigripes]